MPSERIRDRDRVLVVGKVGTRKSTKAKELIAQERARGTRVVVWDVHDEHSIAGRKTPHQRLGTLTQWCSVDELFLHPERMLDRADLGLAVVPSAKRRECAEDFAEFAELMMSTGNLLVVVEEVGWFGRASHEATNALEELATQARHQGVACMFISQAAAHIPKTARRQMSQLWSGRQDDPEDVRAIRQIAGPAFAERVKQLPVGELLHWRDDMKPEAQPNA